VGWASVEQFSWLKLITGPITFESKGAINVVELKFHALASVLDENNQLHALVALTRKKKTGAQWTESWTDRDAMQKNPPLPGTEPQTFEIVLLK
jgi:hypothetical protein